MQTKQKQQDLAVTVQGHNGVTTCIDHAAMYNIELVWCNIAYTQLQKTCIMHVSCIYKAFREIQHVQAYIYACIYIYVCRNKFPYYQL